MHWEHNKNFNQDDRNSCFYILVPDEWDVTCPDCTPKNQRACEKCSGIGYVDWVQYIIGKTSNVEVLNTSIEDLMTTIKVSVETKDVVKKGLETDWYN